jgi:hypothetical protein
MYYRVAIQGDPSLPWQWKSTPLSSLNTLLQWLQFFRAFPKARLRIFSSASRHVGHAGTSRRHPSPSNPHPTREAGEIGLDPEKWRK